MAEHSVICSIVVVLGFFGGKYLKKRHQKATDIELSNLSSRANSLPDIPAETQSDGSWFSWSRKRNQSTTEADDT